MGALLAEAALAGHAKQYLERELSDGDWRLVGIINSANGTTTARVIRSGDGQELSDVLIAYGYAARSNGRWDWCGENANLHHVLADESPPHGPNLWWPAGDVFHARASD